MAFKGMRAVVVVCVFLTGVCWLTDCKSKTETEKKANPAAVKCLEDGYKLEPIVKDGITSGHLCVNPDTGNKCEVWRYFREECNLERDGVDLCPPQKNGNPG